MTPRRAALLIGGAMAALALGTPARGAPAVGSFAPPVGQPLILSRTVVRELFDGKQIVATRRYRVHFERESQGWRLDGELVESEIDAPPSLAALAALERARPDDALFPMWLQADGRIVAGRERPTSREALDRAVGLVLAQADTAPAGAADPAQVRAFVSRLQALAAGPAIAQWPEALFVPAPASETDARTFTLPDGSDGRVSTALHRRAAAGMGVTGAAERVTVTEIAGDRRETRESWTLAPPTD